MALLEVRELQVKFKGFELNVPELKLSEGEILAIAGRNGSGKSTFLRAIVGLQPFSGDLLILGKNRRDFKVSELAQVIGYVPQQIYFSFPFTVTYVLALVAKKFNSGNYLDEVVTYLLSADVLLKRVTQLSFGQHRLVNLALAVLKRPKILLLDEPTLGLDAWNRKKVAKLIKELRDEGVGILVVTHDLEDMPHDKVFLMRQYSNRRVNISVLKAT